MLHKCFFSTALTSTGWVWSTIIKLLALSSVSKQCLQSINMANLKILLKKSLELWLELEPAGRGVWTLPLCYADPPHPMLHKCIFLNGPTPASFSFIFVFSYNNKHFSVASEIWTRIFRAVGESADHNTTTTAQYRTIVYFSAEFELGSSEPRAEILTVTPPPRSTEDPLFGWNQNLRNG